MFRLKTLLVTAIWIFIAQTGQAQQHCNMWLRGTLSVPVNHPFKADFELQHRRQNGFGNNNLFNKNLMFTFRSWVHYQPNAALKFSLSPFAYFTNYKVIQKQADETAKPNKEIRFSAAVEWQHALAKKMYLVNRTAVEYRLFDSISNIIRFRNRFGFRYNLTEKMKVSVYDELLFNLAGTTTAHFFDHNRVGFDFEYPVSANLKFDIGYIRIVRLPLTSSTKLYENDAFMNFTYLLRKQAKKPHFIG